MTPIPPARRTADVWPPVAVPAPQINRRYRNTARWDAKPSTGNTR